MKRIALFALAATLGLASCQKEDAVQPAAGQVTTASTDAVKTYYGTGVGGTRSDSETNCFFRLLEQTNKVNTPAGASKIKYSGHYFESPKKRWVCKCQVTI